MPLSRHRPRSFAERPNAVATARKPANENANGVLGAWEDGSFRFNSPAAEEQWVRNAYKAGVNPATWQHGKEVDERTAEIVHAGLGGTLPGMYLGPDGKYRTINPKTIEAPETRAHRSQHFHGKTMDQLAAAKMPGEDEWVERWKAGRTAINDNAQQKTVPAISIPAPIEGPSPRVTPPAGTAEEAPTQNLDRITQEGAADTPSQQPSKKIATRPFEGRSGFRTAPVTQTEKDLARLGAQSLSGDTADYLRAGTGAIGDLFEGKSLSDSFSERLKREEQETAAARERQGLLGVGVEAGVGFIPIVGDASGLVADAKDWLENGDDWGWEDYGLVALGVVPGMPNRKATKGTLEIGEELLEKAGAAGDEIADLGKGRGKVDSASNVVSLDLHAALEEAKKNVYSPKEARRLETENRGLIYVQGNLQGSERARAHQSGGSGAFSDAESKKFADPALRYDNPNPRGLSYIRFDNAYVPEGENYTMLVDSKTKLAIWSKKTQAKTIRTLERAKQAILQNPNYKLMYEFDTEEAAEEARIFIRDNKYSAYVQVGVRKP
jgi:hypothetical protein